jgi:two-component system, chemotaxis family, protein-glutamate methylesterase/glutaminase
VAGRDIVVIGASAGGIEALTALVGQLSPDLPSSLFIAQHVGSKSVLPAILRRAGRLPASHPEHLTKIEPGHIYVAPPNMHMLLGEGVVRVESGPRENSVRPAADVLFRSAARRYGPRVIGVVLSGMLRDGTAGLMTIANARGITVAQDPKEAICPEMPRSAIERGAVQHVLPIREIVGLIERLSREQAAPKERPMANDSEDATDPRVNGEASAFSCPECGGVLWQLDTQGVLQFRCRVGHAYIDESLMDEQSEQLEGALWAAVRALEEHTHMNRRLARRATDHGHELTARRFDQHAADAEHHATLIRQALAERARALAAEHGAAAEDRTDDKP